jgi:hypothetical protein
LPGVAPLDEKARAAPETQEDQDKSEKVTDFLRKQNQI